MRYLNEQQIFDFLEGHLQDNDTSIYVSLLKNGKGKRHFVVSNERGVIQDATEIRDLKDLYECDYELKRDWGLESYITGQCAVKGIGYKQHEHLRESIIYHIFKNYEQRRKTTRTHK